MKKVLFIFVAFVAIVFSSCSNEMTSVAPPTTPNKIEGSAKQAALAALQGQIATINNSACISTPETRGLGSFFRRLWRVVYTDAVGAIFGFKFGPVGSVVGAAACSTFTGVQDEMNSRATLEQSNLEFKYKLNDDLSDLVPITDTETQPTIQDSIGYLHNKAILNLNKELKPISINSIPVLLQDEVKAEMPKQYTFTPTDSINLNQTYQMFVKNEQAFTGNDIDTYEKHLVACYPQQSGEIKVVSEFLKGISSIEAESEKEYIKTILKLIDEANLSAEVKQSLRNGVIVGNASHRLWQLKPKSDFQNNKFTDNNK